jgi:NTE family protein
VDEAGTANLNIALHYDSENQVGLNLAVIKRNLLPGLRVVGEFDIAENPRADVNLLQYINDKQSWGVQTGALYRNSDIPLVDETSALQGTYRNRYFNPYIGFFNTAKRNRLYGISFQHQFSRMKPKVAGSELRILERLRWASWSVKAAYTSNNLNRRFFPTKGANYNVSAKYSFANNYEFLVTDSTGTFDLTFKPTNFFSLEFRHQNRWQLTEKLSLGLKDYLVFNFIQDNELALPYFNDQAFVGGYRPLLHNANEFWGAKPLEFNSDNMFYNEILIQYEFIKNLYLELASQYVNFVYPMQWVYGDAENAEYYLPEDREGLWGYGARLSYMSLLGPITVGIASRQETSAWNAFFSIGFYY